METTPLVSIVERIRSELNLVKEVPHFDPSNGNENARFLFVLEAPGRQAVESGIVSLNNNDQTAQNFRKQLMAANIKSSDIALWNVVPWYLGNPEKTKIRGALASDTKAGLGYLLDVISAIKKLEYIVLVGGAARRAHIFLSSRTTVRILSCHHPSPKVVNSTPATFEENVAVFSHMLNNKQAY